MNLYYSIDQLLKDIDIDNLLQDNSRNSVNKYKTNIWIDNNIKYGEIIFDLEIKYDKDMNFYTFGKMSIILPNILIESLINNDGHKINLFNSKFNVISNLCVRNNEIVDVKFNISNEYFIDNDNNIYGLILLNEINV